MQTLKVSVILPLKNEEANIQPVIEHLRKTSSLFPIEIIVVDGRSSDRTKEKALSLSDLFIESQSSNRSFQMHLGALQATGTILLFLHADTRLPDSWQVFLSRAFIENPKPPIAGAFSLGFDSTKFFYKLIASLANFRTKLTGIPHGDQAFIVHRKAYFSAGGFPDAPLMEEYLIVPRLKRLGEVQIFPEPVRTSVRKYEQRGALKNSLKNSLLVFLFYLGVSPKQLAEWYY